MAQLLAGLAASALFGWLAVRSVRKVELTGRARVTYLSSTLTFYGFLAAFSAFVGYSGVRPQDDAVTAVFARVCALLAVLSILTFLIHLVVGPKPESAGHLVEIYHAVPHPDASSEHNAYYVALCDSCGWTEFPDGNVIGADEVTQLREKAARHTTNIADVVVRRDF